MLPRFGCCAACLAVFACPWCGQHVKTFMWFVAQEAVEAVVGILGMAPCDGTDAVPPNARSHTVLLAGTLIGNAQVRPACTRFLFECRTNAISYIRSKFLCMRLTNSCVSARQH